MIIDDESSSVITEIKVFVSYSEVDRNFKIHKFEFVNKGKIMEKF